MFGSCSSFNDMNLKQVAIYPTLGCW